MFKLEQIDGTNRYRIHGGDTKTFGCAPDGPPVPVGDSDAIDTQIVVANIAKYTGHGTSFGYVISEPSEIMGGHKIRAIQFYKILK